MPADDAYIVTFTYEGESFNVWVWPHHVDGEATCLVNVRDGERWVPLEVLGGVAPRLEVQEALF